MIIIMTMCLPLSSTPTQFQLLSLTPLWGFSPTPDSGPNFECGLGAFQEASIFDLMAQLGSWVCASLDWVPTCQCSCVLLPALLI